MRIVNRPFRAASVISPEEQGIESRDRLCGALQAIFRRELTANMLRSITV